MTRIYFVRHAQPDLTMHDEMLRGLSDKGMRDRERVTEFLSDKSIDIVLSSPYRRAVDTAAHFADMYGLDIITVDDLREREVGSWIDDFDGFVRRQWADFDYRLNGGESLREVQRRCITAVEDILTGYRDKNIAVAGHGTAMSAILNYYDSSFGYDDFVRIRYAMPYIVMLVFDGTRYLGREEYTL